MKGLILAAGKGTRLRPITFSVPKPLIPIANKPIFIYAIESFIKTGVKNIGIVVNEEYIRDFEEKISLMNFGKDIKFNFILQSEPKGIGHAIMAAKEFIGQDCFIVQLGDNIIFHDYIDFTDGFESNSSKCKILLAEVDDITRYGIVEFKNCQISNLVEKPKESTSNLALVGLYLFTSEIFDFISKLSPSPRGEYEITHAINNLFNKYKYLDFDICNHWWKDTGTPKDILEANKFVLTNILQENIVNKSSILTGTTMGTGVSIGSNCELHNCNITNSIILNDVVIENVDISDSIIGESCIIKNLNKNKPNISLILGNQSFIEIK